MIICDEKPSVWRAVIQGISLCVNHKYSECHSEHTPEDAVRLGTAEVKQDWEPQVLLMHDAQVLFFTDLPPV